MAEHMYYTQGVCSQAIKFEIDDDGKLHNVMFAGGCNGNLKGIGALVEGKDAKEIAGILKGLSCGFKGTSCPDQFSKAIEEALQE